MPDVISTRLDPNTSCFNLLFLPFITLTHSQGLFEWKPIDKAILKKQTNKQTTIQYIKQAKPIISSKTPSLWFQHSNLVLEDDRSG